MSGSVVGTAGRRPRGGRPASHLDRV